MSTPGKKKSQTGVVAAIVVGFLVVAVGGWLAVVSPKRSAADKAEKDIAAMQVKYAEHRAALEAAKNNKPVRVADLFRLTKAMPDETDMGTILLELSHVANESGIAFQSITPSAPVFQSGYEVVPIDVVFDGNFYDLADFIYRLRNLVGVYDGKLDATGRLFTVDKVSFDEGHEDFPQLTATLTLAAYVYGVSAPVVVPPAAASTSTDATATTTTSTTPATPPSAAAEATAKGMTG